MIKSKIDEIVVLLENEANSIVINSLHSWTTPPKSLIHRQCLDCSAGARASRRRRSAMQIGAIEIDEAQDGTTDPATVAEGSSVAATIDDDAEEEDDIGTSDDDEAEEEDDVDASDDDQEEEWVNARATVNDEGEEGAIFNTSTWSISRYVYAIASSRRTVMPTYQKIGSSSSR